jgi:hypothetical protein
MCFLPKPKGNKVPDPTPEPQKVADPQEIGGARKAEDKTLFGGIPDLRVDRNSAPAAVNTGGAGLGTLK